MASDLAKPSTGRARIVMFATLFLFWMMLMGKTDTASVLVGLLASFLITLLYRDGFSFFTEFRASPAAIAAGLKYYRYFFTELVKSNVRLSGIVLSPDLPIQPAIIKVKTTLKSRMGRLMLANSITLTPGTFTVEVDGDYLYVHCVTQETDNIEEATRDIVSQLESYLEVMYG